MFVSQYSTASQYSQYRQVSLSPAKPVCEYQHVTADCMGKACSHELHAYTHTHTHPEHGLPPRLLLTVLAPWYDRRKLSSFRAKNTTRKNQFTRPSHADLQQAGIGRKVSFRKVTACKIAKKRASFHDDPRHLQFMLSPLLFPFTPFSFFFLSVILIGLNCCNLSRPTHFQQTVVLHLVDYFPLPSPFACVIFARVLGIRGITYPAIG